MCQHDDIRKRHITSYSLPYIISGPAIFLVAGGLTGTRLYWKRSYIARPTEFTWPGNAYFVCSRVPPVRWMADRVFRQVLAETSQ